MNIRNNQCKACPWRVGVKPEKDIPGGYCVKKHEDLRSTVAKPGDLSMLGSHSLRMMACHESPIEKEQPCVGWLINQLGPGNNLGLRMLAMDGRFKDVRTDGPQHERFEDTLPKITLFDEEHWEELGQRVLLGGRQSMSTVFTLTAAGLARLEQENRRGRRSARSARVSCRRAASGASKVVDRPPCQTYRR